MASEKVKTFTDSNFDEEIKATKSRHPTLARCAQLVTLDLAGRGFGQLGDELDPPRKLVGRELALDVRLDLLGQRLARRLRRTQHNEGPGLDESVAILPADDRRFEHRGMTDDRGLDL